MARSIVVEWNGESSSFAFKKVDRSKLYGRRRRIALDPAGARCERAALTEDGSLILRQGMLAQGYFDQEGQWIANKELVGLGTDGEPLEPRGSTLGKPVPLEGPVPASELLDVRNQSVYALDPEELGDGLRERLLTGEIFRLPFVYRSGWEESWAWLLANMDGQLFALVGKAATPEWCAPHELPTVEEEDDLDDELDFEMF